MSWRHKETGEEVFRIQYIENKQYWKLDSGCEVDWCVDAETVNAEWGNYQTLSGMDVDRDEMEWVQETGLPKCSA